MSLNGHSKNVVHSSTQDPSSHMILTPVQLIFEGKQYNAFFNEKTLKAYYRSDSEYLLILDEDTIHKVRKAYAKIRSNSLIQMTLLGLAGGILAFGLVQYFRKKMRG